MRSEFLYAGIWSDKYGGKQGGQILCFKRNFEVDSYDLVHTVELNNNISCIKVRKDERILYAADETREDNNGFPGGNILVFKLNSEDGVLQLIKECHSMGAYPLDLDFVDDFAVVINHGSTANKVLMTDKDAENRFKMYFEYDESSIVLFQIEENGVIERAYDIQKSHGSGSIPFFQNSVSPHSVSVSPNKKIIIVPERGTDCISVYRVNKVTKILDKVNCVFTKKGCGPRNIAFHPIKQFFYLVHEIEPLIQFFSYEDNGEKITFLGEIPAISEDYKIDAPAASFDAPHPSDIVVHPNGKFVFVLTRSTNTISSFNIDEDTGYLQMADIQSTCGKHPRKIAFSYDNTELYISNLESQNIVRYGIDFENGLLNSPKIIAEKIARISTITSVII